MRFFLVCPANLATGGTELLHQFSRYLSDVGVENYMIYADGDKIHCSTPEVFRKYGVKSVSAYIDAWDSVLVLTETQIHLIKDCHKGTAMIWWLSVDNYFNVYSEKMRQNNVDIFGLKQKNNLVHFVQSSYAMDFVQQYFGVDKPYFLKDYINDAIVDYSIVHRYMYERQNICLYNPKEGYEDIKPVIDACREDIVWVPLVNMKPAELAEVMCKAKIYIDFGAHPGKDRIPREAAACGCCIITNRKGSAAYSQDVCIPERYKVEDTGDIEGVLEKIYDLADYYEERVGEYDSYRERILSEKAEFLCEADAAIEIVKEIVTAKQHRVNMAHVQKYEEVWDAIGEAARLIEQIAEDSRISCNNGDLSDAMNGLLTIDYVLQMIRETAYSEMVDMAND